MHPDRAAVAALAREGYTLIPVYRCLVADELTPVAALARLADEPYAFLFESVVGGERVARYSMLGVRPRARLVGDLASLTVIGADGRSERIAGDPFAAVRAYQRRWRAAAVPGLPRFSGGLVGYWSYDTVRAVEPLPRCPPDPLGLPDVHLLHCDTVLVFDHSFNQLLLIAHLDLGAQDLDAAWERAAHELDHLEQRLRAPLPVRLVQPAPVAEPQWEACTPRARFLDSVRAIHERIRAGDSFQVVLSQRLRAPCRAAPFQVYRSLRSLNPSPYLFYLRLGDSALVGASPELLVRVERGRVAVRPIAGTTRRGASAEEDEVLARALLADPKEIAEHTMLIDLGRNDVGRVCRGGSVRLTERMVIERYSHVQHIVSHVEGELRPELDALDALRACHPAGTVSGAPKVMSMQIIDELEPVKRGPYAGAVGYLDFRGNLDTCIALRMAILTPGWAHVQAGAGVVADSTPEGEYEETLRKARATLAAIARAERF
ncbi:MAG: anthranilate synthase component I [Planctomycetes bacterium]|nr:anthranilate synthase component I [Planctomycetota bacterium]